jgi:hypothetical protein
MDPCFFLFLDRIGIYKKYYLPFDSPGNGNKNGIYSVLLRDYNSHAAASCMNRLAKFR